MGVTSYKVLSKMLTKFPFFIHLYDYITYTCVYMMANIANLIKPFMPDASNKIKDMLSFADYKWEEEVIKGDIKVKNYYIVYFLIIIVHLINIVQVWFAVFYKTLGIYHSF